MGVSGGDATGRGLNIQRPQDTILWSGEAVQRARNNANILSSSESMWNMWSSSSLRRLYSFRRLFCRCRHTIKCRLRGFNEPGLRQFWQLFNICPVGPTHSHDGVYLWQFSIRKTLSIRRHQPVGPGGTQRRRFPFQRGKFMHVSFMYLFIYFTFVIITVVFKHTCLFFLFVFFVVVDFGGGLLLDCEKRE